MTKAKTKKRTRIGKFIIDHIQNNLREYIIITIIFLIGVFLGVLFVNTVQEEQKNEITTYLNSGIQELKNQGNINKNALLIESFKENSVLAFSLWFAGTTIIGIPIVFGLVLFRGFCLGYTISACIATMGLGNGLGFVLTTIVLQNILLIPAILALAVSGIKLYKSIMKDKRKENIKLEIIRHTIFSLIMLAVCLVASVIEVQVSDSLLFALLKYF